MNKLSISTLEKIRNFGIAFWLMVGLLVTIFSSIKSFRIFIKNMFPFITQITPTLFLIGVIFCIILIYKFLNLMDIIIKKKEFAIRPNLKIIGYGVDDNIGKSISHYKNDSFIAMYMGGIEELIYLDIINIPIEKDIDGKSKALNVSVSMELRDWDGGSHLHNNIFGKWVIPENKNGEIGIDIPPDEENATRLGIAIRKTIDDFTWILDAERAYFDKNGYANKLDYIGSCENLVLMTKIKGNNFPDGDTSFFKITNIRNEKLAIEEMEDGNDWLDRANFSSAEIWKNS